MSYKDRINPKTGKKEYKYRYYYKDTNGVRHQSDTGWFTTKKAAREDGENKKEEKESGTFRNDGKKLITTVFDEFIEELHAKDIEDVSTTSYKTYYETASAIRKKYIPPAIEGAQIRTLNSHKFIIWIRFINGKKNVGGKYIRACKTILNKFNEYLMLNDYYDNDEKVKIENALKAEKLKSIDEHNREKNNKRKPLRIDEVHRLTGYFKEKGLGAFDNFYWYTLFYVMFFSGCRVEEIVGLKWHAVKFDERLLNIEDAITRNEGDKKVYERMKTGEKKTKNDNSKREIPILDFYYPLLDDYKESYEYQFNLNEEEMQDCFVFPNLARNDPRAYQKHDNILKALRKAVDATGLAKTDSQMFRHSCAYFLIEPQPNGLGMEYYAVYEYFGHQDDKMLREIYGKLKKSQVTDRLRISFADVATPPPLTGQEADEEGLRKKLIDQILGNVSPSGDSRRERIRQQIKIVEENYDRDIYYYRFKDKEIIDEYCSSNYSRLKFVQRDEITE